MLKNDPDVEKRKKIPREEKKKEPEDSQSTLNKRTRSESFDSIGCWEMQQGGKWESVTMKMSGKEEEGTNDDTTQNLAEGGGGE